MPKHEFTQDDLDRMVDESLERRRLRRQSAQGAPGVDQGVTERLRAAMARRRAQQTGQQQTGLRLV